MTPPPQAAAQPRSYAPVTNTKDNPPCNTLFIGNLSEHTSEDELRGIFQGQPGELWLILAMAQQQQSSAKPRLKTNPAWVARHARFSACGVVDVSVSHSGLLGPTPQSKERDGLRACRLPAAEAGAGRALNHLLRGVC